MLSTMIGIDAGPRGCDGLELKLQGRLPVDQGSLSLWAYGIGADEATNEQYAQVE